MGAKKGNTNGQATWYKGNQETTVMVGAKVPQSLWEKLNLILRPGESKSAAIMRGIELLVAERSKAESN